MTYELRRRYEQEGAAIKPRVKRSSHNILLHKPTDADQGDEERRGAETIETNMGQARPQGRQARVHEFGGICLLKV